ncbi:MAG: tetratricopeptide repeat protein [Steroidobacteraceae bacterium]|jgi:predicted negative regulator of RcsB-dependent stress response
MAEDYLTDDEQLEHVKQLFAEYGPWVLGAVVVGLGLAFGYRYYNQHMNDRALDASAQFADMSAAVEGSDPAKARQIADGLIKSYPRSPYADHAQLVLARLAVDANQEAGAVGPLQEVIEHSKDAELQHIARLRLARVQIDQGKPDEALKTLSDLPGTFAARYDEVRGDAYYAKKDPAKATELYKKALGEGDPQSMESALLALKIADLGLVPAAGPPMAATAPPTPAAPAAPVSSTQAKP